MKTENMPKGCALMKCVYWDEAEGICTHEGLCVYKVLVDREKMQEQLDYLRTMSIPPACNETSEQWAQRKVHLIAGWLSKLLKETHEPDDNLG